MPKRTDLHTILLIGAGPIIIGQACEFDYSGTQACKALKDEGYRVVLVNSNPATIMTDPEVADATYIEPITPEIVAKIIERERPEALLPTMGGQTALNTAKALAENGTLERFGVELIGADLEAINKAEDRQLFHEAMERIGLDMPRSLVARSMADARAALEVTGLPAIVRPSFTLGGMGGGIAYNKEEFEQIVAGGLDASPVGEVLVEESVLGWKEFEMEVVRDKNDNAIIVCAIENVDPMGVHTGDSITVAPALTLTDKEYQLMRAASIATLREVGVETGGSNVQFAVNPDNGRLVVIEMNPRVSRSSALASKATGFPIAKIAAKLAVGYTLDEIDNDITGATPASFEPSIDYVVTKVPRFTFEKFPETEATLTTSMKSVGEAMAIGRTFKESLQKALRSLETGLSGLDETAAMAAPDPATAVRAALARPTPERLRHIADAFRLGFGVDEVARLSRYEPWFLRQIEEIVAAEGGGAGGGPAERRGRDAGAEGRRLLGQTPRQAHGLERGGGAAPPARSRRAAGLQADRHLRRRVPGAHALHVRDLRGRHLGRPARVREPAERAPQGDDPRGRAEPDRPGDRVRLLLRPRRVRVEGRRRRDDHGQLQPRDGLDRPRDLGPALLRAADGRGRDRDRRRRGVERQSSGRHRPARRADAPAAGGGAARGRHPNLRHLARRDRPSPRTATASRSSCASLASSSRRTRSASTRPRRSTRRGRSACRSSSGRPTCSAGGRCGSCARWRR